MFKIVQLVDVLIILIRIYYYVLLARVILSWFVIGQADKGALSDLYRIIYAVTEPLLAPIRKIIPAIGAGGGYIDLSPFILMLLLWFAESFLRTL